MEYITYKRFKTRAICGDVNIPFGTILHEQDGMLYWNGNPVCSATSENGWNYFRPNTLEGMHRWELLEKLYNGMRKTAAQTILQMRGGQIRRMATGRIA